jgi:AMP nucleosidase
MTGNLSPSEAIDKATELYNAAVGRLRAALEAFVTKGQTPDPQARPRGDFCYPELRLAYDPNGPVPPLSRAFAKLSEGGLYISTITQPTFFRKYFLEQLEQICADFPVTLDVVISKSEIPYPYVLEHASNIDAEALPPAEFARWFPTSRSSASSTTPARRSSMCSATSCSRTIIAMSITSSNGPSSG